MTKLLLLLALILSISSCSKYADEVFVPEPEREGAIKSFNAVIDDESVSRVGLNSDYKAIWHENDAMMIAVYDADDAAATPSIIECNIDNETISTTTSSATFHCKSPIYASDEMYAIYPYDASYDGSTFAGGSVAERAFTLTLPNQSRSDDGYFRYPQLVGKWDSSTNMFLFQNQFTILGISLTSETACELQSISVTGNNEEKMWGDAVISSIDGSITLAETAHTTASIDCNGIELGSDKTTVYIAIPPQNYTKGLTVKIGCKTGYMTKTLKSGGFDCSAYTNTVVKLPQVAVELTPSPIIADVTRVTDGSAVVAWTITSSNVEYLSEPYPNQSASWTNDIAKTYKVAIYKSPNCTSSDLIVSYANVSGLFSSPQLPPRFIFTNLEPSTDYWVMIENTTDGTELATPLKVTTSAPLADKNAVVTTNATTGDLILYENFNKLIYAGDLTTRAAGISRGDRSSLTSFIYPEGELSDYSSDAAEKKFYLVGGGTEIGLFNTLNGLIDDMGLDNWGWIGGKSGATGGSVCARTGYVKIGTSGNRSAIITPLLSAIPEGKNASVRVDFRACPYGDAKASITASEKNIIVKPLYDTSLASNWRVSYSSEGKGAPLTLEGDNNTYWKEYSVELFNITNATRIAFSGNLASTTTNRFMLDDIRITVTNLQDVTDDKVEGRITAHANDGGAGVKGVIVTDGFSVVETDADGYYDMPYNAAANFISYTTPADREIAVDSDGYPLFFKQLNAAGTYNFTLDRKIDVQSLWHLFVMADPQTKEASGTTNSKCLPYFAKVAADMKSTIENYGYNSATSVDGNKRAYGMVLGDVIWNSSRSHMEAMRAAMTADNTNVEWFTVPGNHDWYVSDSDTSPSLDNYHSIFGPSRYSFDRGNVHIIGMNNTIAGEGIAGEDYGKGFTANEFAWLEKDLAKVSTDKCVVLCVHIPFFDGTSARHTEYYNETLALLAKYSNAYIFSGHNHYAKHYLHSSTYNYIHEINHAAACGQFWNVKVCADGTPSGYTVYTFNGNDIIENRFKAVGIDGYDNYANAIRMYLGSDSANPTNSSSYITNYTFGKAANVVYANVFEGYALNNEDTSPISRKGWSVELYMDGKKVCDMVPVKSSDTTYGYHDKPATCKTTSTYFGTYVYNTNYLRNDADWWWMAKALQGNTSIINRNGNYWNGALTNSGYKKPTSHIYAGTLPEEVTNSATNVTIKATTPWGKVYECSTFTKFTQSTGLSWQ